MQAAPPKTRDFTALESLEGALDWWREAGVDADFHDESSGWLAAPVADDAVAAPPPPAPPPIQRKTPLQRALEQGDVPATPVDRGALPDTLEKFREWWMTEPTLADGALDRRVPPRGVKGAKLMLLLPQPFDDDAEGLLTGGAGKFVDAMLRALGIAGHETYVASALPAPMAMPDWGQLAAGGLGEIASAHIALAAPQRVILFGRAQLALFGKSPEDAREPLSIDCAGQPFPLLAAPDLRNLARSAARRETFWNRWLDWTR
ncbi:hypothetical protein K3174_01200 [Qipengyuania sp. 6D47A]|uniref:Uracil-DNA glycosylase n=2 Tax=Qipengyuania qiaonensis TaxID=2867240 RepID=A0ABS7J1D1_9SPHN|nr:hypothetical protein [Qipengyuania qiaonensis]